MRCARTLAAPTAGSRVGWGGCCCCRRRWRAWPTSHISVRRLDTEWLVSPGRGVAVSTTKPASACAHTYELPQRTQTHRPFAPAASRTATAALSP
jgi:hypothetical protein